jgi:hypothetical protein
MATSAHGHRSRPVPLRQATVWKRYGYFWVTAALFLLALGGHWWLGWEQYVGEQRIHQAPVEVTDFLAQIGRDTLENWQSEFLQLIWQVSGLALFLNVHSPQSREEDDRLEEKLDAILRAVEPERAERIIAELDDRFDRSEPSA